MDHGLELGCYAVPETHSQCAAVDCWGMHFVAEQQVELAGPEPDGGALTPEDELSAVAGVWVSPAGLILDPEQIGGALAVLVLLVASLAELAVLESLFLWADQVQKQSVHPDLGLEKPS